jgi:hypothetical protein
MGFRGAGRLGAVKLISGGLPLAVGGVGTLLDSVNIRREISRLYDKDPEGWRVLVGKDRMGFYDVLISHGAEAWQVKEFEVNPYKFIGLGSKLPSSTPGPLISNEHPFGLRPVALDQMKELAGLIDDPRAVSELAGKLLREKPISSNEAVESPAILQGPILQSHRPLEALSSAHTRLDERLRKELQRIVHRDFRHTVAPYI